MANLLDIRRRIRSVRNTEQITKAMKTVAAAKLRRAQERVFAARPYANQIRRVLANLSAHTENLTHPLLEVREEDRIALVVVTADRGLCGAFNSSISRAANEFLASHRNQNVQLIAVGRKGRDYFRLREVSIFEEYINIFSRLDFQHSAAIGRRIAKLYGNCETDAVYLAYNEFKSVLQQRIVIEPLLPLRSSEFEREEEPAEYIYEQPPDEVLSRILPQYIDVQVHRALLESVASEQGARMTAMDTASRNAGEMIDSLTLKMNRIRQAAITREIIEVVSGASV